MYSIRLHLRHLCKNLENGRKASECSFWACTSGIYCKYSGIFPCWYLAWFQWHFIFWGLYNGIVIAVSDICAPLFAKITERLHINVKSKAFYLFRIIRTFIIVNIGWYFDRIYDIRDCFLCMKNTIFNFQMSQLDEFLGPILKIMPTKAYVIVTVALCIVFADSVIKERGKDAITLLDNRPLVLRWLLYFGMIFMILESFNFAVDAGGFMYANY